MVVRPRLLPDTVSKAGFEELDPITQWFLGGVGTAGAEATGINDDERYGLALLNVGSGGKSFETTSGNGTYQFRNNNTGNTFIGGLNVTGGGATFASLTVTSGASIGGNLGVTGSLSVTGPAGFSSSASVGGTLSVTGAASFATGATVGGALTVTGTATFASSAAVGGGLTVTGPATFGTSVTINDTLNVTGGTVLHSSLVVTGPTTFRTDVNIEQGLTVTGATHIGSALTVDSNVTLGNATGDTVTIAGDLTVGGNALATKQDTNQVRISHGSFEGSYELTIGTGSSLYCHGDASVQDLTVREDVTWGNWSDAGIDVTDSNGDTWSSNGRIRVNLNGGNQVLIPWFTS